MPRSGAPNSGAEQRHGVGHAERGGIHQGCVGGGVVGEVAECGVKRDDGRIGPRLELGDVDGRIDGLVGGREVHRGRRPSAGD